MDVIRVIVREQNGIDAAYSRGDQLKPQLGRRIDEDACTSIRLDQRADASSLVPGVRRPAHFARASNLRDAKAGSCPQEGELQTISTLSKLVVPGRSNGTPAVTMILSPFAASSRRTTTPLVCSIISS
jgi:hypothetical protein